MSVRRRKLHGKAGRVGEISKHLTQVLHESHPDAAAVRKSAAEATPLLAELRHETLRQNGPHATLVASGLEDLSKALVQLAHAAGTADGQSAMGHIVVGKKALDHARAKAVRAGDAWPL